MPFRNSFSMLLEGMRYKFLFVPSKDDIVNFTVLPASIAFRASDSFSTIL
jgi:hypothetical protein